MGNIKEVEMIEGRNISLGEGLCSIPIELLRAQAKGKILFIVGAGISRNSGLPSFEELVLNTYKNLDLSVYDCMKTIEEKKTSVGDGCKSVKSDQQAEINAFYRSEYDVCLGLLERRLFFKSQNETGVRAEVAKIIGNPSAKPAGIHESIIKLSNRGNALAVVTTNFDLLLEGAARKLKKPQQTYSIGEIMRPSERPEFSGILHPKDLGITLALARSLGDQTTPKFRPSSGSRSSHSTRQIRRRMSSIV